METKKEVDTIKRESDHFLRLIQIIFGLVFVQGLTLNRQILINPIGEDNFLPFLCLVVILTTTVMSWMDFHRTAERRPYIIDRLSEKYRVGADFLVVVAYAFVLFSIEHIKIDKTASLATYLFGYWFIFFWYGVSGELRVKTYGVPASRSNLIRIFFFIYLALWLAYIFFRDWANSILGDKTYVDVISVLFVLAIMISYRFVRSRIIRKRDGLKKSGLKIGVDVDGVLADQITGISKRSSKKIGVSFTYGDVTEWEYKIGPSDIAKEIEEALLNDPSYATEMAIHRGAKDAIETMWKKNWITIITARPRQVDFLTTKWLNKQEIQYDEYINSRTAEKSSHGVDVLIDDYLGNIKKLLQNTAQYAILFDRPWNQKRVELKPWIKKGRLFIVKSWHEIPPIIETILAKRQS